MTYNEDTAEVEPRDADEWLDIILEAGSDYWGEEIAERDNTSIHHLYEPLADGLAQLEEELEQVINALRIQTAEGKALDIQGKKLGIRRIDASKATGEVTFSRSNTATKDYLIEKGTEVKTSGINPIHFETTEKAFIREGETSATASIIAKREGPEGNVASDTIDEPSIYPAGVQSVTNNHPTSGGRSTENDESYRNRIKSAIGDIKSVSGYHIYQLLSERDYVRSVNFIDNSSDISDNSLDPHQAEIVVDAAAGHSEEIAQTILENIPMGIDLVGGIRGSKNTATATLPNGQEFTITYSEPAEIDIYVDANVNLNENISKEKIKNRIVEYIGGTKVNGSIIFGELSTGEDVLYGEVEYAIRDVDGVYDVESLEIGTSSSPTSTSDISIPESKLATIDAADISITE